MYLSLRTRRRARTFTAMAAGSLLAALGVAITPAGAASTVLTTGQTAPFVSVAYHYLDAACTNYEKDVTPQQAFVTGPGTPPAGTGSLRFTLGSDTGQFEAFRTDHYDGTLISDISAMQYSTYVETAGKQPPYFRLTLDLNNNGSYDQGIDHSLFFFPANNQLQAAVTAGQWQTWNLGTGLWNIDGDTGNVGQVTLGAYAIANPGAKIVESFQGGPEAGGFTVAQGCGGANTSDSVSYVDKLSVTVKGTADTYDLDVPAVQTPPPGGTTQPEPMTGGNGYREVAADGGIFTFGNRNFHGSTGDMKLNAPIVGGATDVSNYDGYWIVASDGGVFNFNAPFYGSLGDRRLSSPAVEIEPTPTGDGYWIVQADGTVTPFGGAEFEGDMRGKGLNKPIIGMSVAPDGKGYWLVAQDGGIFNFGSAQFLGSMGDKKLNAPVIDLAPTPDGEGYYLVAEDGGVFTFGSAEFKGSTGDMKLNKPVVAMLVAPNGAGYWLGASDGGIFTFGAPAVDFLGSMGGTPLNAPVLDLIN